MKENEGSRERVRAVALNLNLSSIYNCTHLRPQYPHRTSTHKRLCLAGSITYGSENCRMAQCNFTTIPIKFLILVEMEYWSRIEFWQMQNLFSVSNSLCLMPMWIQNGIQTKNMFFYCFGWHHKHHFVQCLFPINVRAMSLFRFFFLFLMKTFDRLVFCEVDK